MSAQEYNIVRSLTLHEIQINPTYRVMVRQYAQQYCQGFMRDALMKIAK